MKITFEGKSIHEIVDEMKHVLAMYPGRGNPASFGMGIGTQQVSKPEGPGPEGPKAPEEKPTNLFGGTSSEKPEGSATKKPRTPKQLENDERLRQAALAKIAAKKALKADMGAGIVQPVRPTPPKSEPVLRPPPPPPATAESLGLQPDEVVKLREKTIAELQEAYANGHQAEVFELLSRFGNGAKSFRELPPESFVPIREAIDNGALT